MNKVLTQKSLFAAALFAAIGFATLASGGAQAANNSFDRCKATTKKQVVDCCEKHVLQLGRRPLWMVESGKSCASAAKCVWVTVYGDGPLTYVAAPKRVKKCYIPRQNPQNNDNGKSSTDRTPEPKQDPQTSGGND
jgi:hypothetical protein